MPLSEAGTASLQEVAQQLATLKPDVLYSSGNESSGPTAEHLSSLCSLKDRKIASLHELDCGIWQGLQIKQIKQRYGKAYRQWRSDPTSVTPPQGESVQSALERVQESLEILHKKNGDKTVVVVAARIFAALIQCELTETDLGQLWDVEEQAPAMQVFNFNGEHE